MKGIFASLLLFLAGHSYSQSPVIDSLNKLIANASSDTARINISIKKIASLTEVNLDTAIAFGLATIEEAKKINYTKGEASARVRTAGAYDFKGDWKAAEENLTIAGELFKSLKDSAGRGLFYSGYGMMLSMQGRYDTAILYMQKAISIGEQLNDAGLLGNLYGNIAIAFYMKSNYSQALFYQQKGLRLAEAEKNVNSQAYAVVNMALTYKSMGDTIRAEESLLKAVILGKQVAAKNVELYAYSNLATIYEARNELNKSYEYAMKAATLGQEMGDQGIQSSSLGKAAIILAHQQQFTEAEALAKRSMVIADSSNQPFNIYQTYSSMGAVLRLGGKCKEAITYYEKALNAMKDADIFDEQFGTTYAHLSECYEKTGNSVKALSTYKVAAEIVDSMRNRENVRKATELTMNYEFDKKQEVAKAEQQKEKAIVRARQMALIIGLVLTLALAVIAFTAFRNKQRANKLLHRQKEEIQSTLTELKATQLQLIQSEKMASLGELTAGIAHEIENPLNFVNNFSEVNTELITELKNEIMAGNNEEALLLAKDIEGNEQKITHHGKRADSIVKGMLQHSRVSSGAKTLTDINALTNEYLRIGYHSQRAKEKSFQAILQNNFDPKLEKIAVIPQDIGRVLLNIYSNAMHYLSEKKNLSPADYEPTLITYTKQLPKSIEIRISDNGPGIPQKSLDKIFQPFFTTKPTGSGTGLGLSISYDIIKAHGGEINVETKAGEGATFIIHLPVTTA